MPRDYSNLDRDFGPRFLDARRQRRISQEAVAAGMASRGFKLHVTAIGKIERGERRVSLGEAAALASTVGRTLDDVIEGRMLSAEMTHLDGARANLIFSAQQFVESLARLALLGDQHDGLLSPEEREQIRDAIELETPAQVLRVEPLGHVIDRAIEVSAEGAWLRMLRKCLARDEAALRAANLPAINRK